MKAAPLLWFAGLLAVTALLAQFSSRTASAPEAAEPRIPLIQPSLNKEIKTFSIEGIDVERVDASDWSGFTKQEIGHEGVCDWTRGPLYVDTQMSMVGSIKGGSQISINGSELLRVGDNFDRAIQRLSPFLTVQELPQVNKVLLVGQYHERKFRIDVGLRCRIVREIFECRN